MMVVNVDGTDFIVMPRDQFVDLLDHRDAIRHHLGGAEPEPAAAEEPVPEDAKVIVEL